MSHPILFPFEEDMLEVEKITFIIMFEQIIPADKEIMILVELPELAVDYIEVLVGKEVVDLIDVLLFF